MKNLPVKQEMQIKFLGQEDPLKKEMATYSSTLAWETHGQGSLAIYRHAISRVGHDLATKPPP